MTDLETTGFWATLFVVSDWAIRLAMLPIVPTRRSPEAAKGWLLFIFFLPWLGLILYLLIGRPRVPRWRTERFRQFMHAIEPIRQKMRALPLLALGVDVRIALPVRVGRKAARFDLRNHRKLAVVDGRVGYTGSQNMIAADFRPGLTNSELMVRIEGPSALQLQAVFASDWYVESGEFVGEDCFPVPRAAGDVPAQVLPNGPSSSSQPAQRKVVNLIHLATKRVVVTTPYFIPGQSLQNALETAVLRGAEVHLIVDEHMDQFLVGSAQRSYYEELLAAGVRIHACTEAFLHAKSVSIDGQVAWIGTCNMDMRSFELNEEVVALFFDRRIAAQLAALEERYMRGARRVTLDAWRRRPFAQQLLQNLARLVSPLL